MKKIIRFILLMLAGVIYVVVKTLFDLTKVYKWRSACGVDWWGRYMRRKDGGLFFDFVHVVYGYNDTCPGNDLVIEAYEFVRS